MIGPRSFFIAVARWEGTSFLLLLGVAVPLKRLAGIPEPVQWLGMVHGALTFVFLMALVSVGRMERWSYGRIAAAFAASLFPFGTFAFERTLPPEPSPDPV